MQPCARPTDLFVVSCPDPTLASVTLSSHMTNGILLTRHNQEIAQWSPDPFPRERVGSGHETMMKAMEMEIQTIEDIDTIIYAAFSFITHEDCIGWIEDSSIYNM